MQCDTVEVPEGIRQRVRALCFALPEVTVRADESRVKTRSTAWSYDIRRRSFCLLVASVGRTGKAIQLLILRTDQGEREALLAIGHPYFVPPRTRSDRIGVLLTNETDWAEIRELVTESYRIVAPKKLIAQLDHHTIWPVTQTTGSAAQVPPPDSAVAGLAPICPQSGMLP